MSQRSGLGKPCKCLPRLLEGEEERSSGASICQPFNVALFPMLILSSSVEISAVPRLVLALRCEVCAPKSRHDTRPDILVAWRKN